MNPTIKKVINSKASLCDKQSNMLIYEIVIISVCIFFMSSDLPCKQFISEEKMAAKMRDLRISDQSPSSRNHISPLEAWKVLQEIDDRSAHGITPPIGRASLVIILHDVARFTPLLARLVQ